MRHAMTRPVDGAAAVDAHDASTSGLGKPAHTAEAVFHIVHRLPPERLGQGSPPPLAATATTFHLALPAGVSTFEREHAPTGDRWVGDFAVERPGWDFVAVEPGVPSSQEHDRLVRVQAEQQRNSMSAAIRPLCGTGQRR